ncbi:TrkH family potassium uptake protein [Marinifilum sp. N1E240]|uniref:TrkH family potassium uptake protein n=1 Tax=Marinifilum sp. N1E240 TaxID=2608082 RepID=UPI001417CD5A|nr:potassium transporter TrkG [uncultured Marinifilum sp.]MPQ47417.1 TrkH family potassium uptake protein [Marinifilum sp. N1E240]
MVKFKIILNILGKLLVGESFFLFLSLIVSLIYGESDSLAFLKAGLITLVVGSLSYLTSKGVKKDLGKREGYIIVSLVWVVFSIFGCLPYLFSGAIPNVTNAFFETMSGFTTTGSSILNNIEELPHGILFWRSLTQWMGGMGIIVMFLAILPTLGIGGRELFVAEVPGPAPDKLTPRIKETARNLWGLYMLFTLIQTILLFAGGMTFFDAINHSLTTMATGGYSTKQASVGFFTSPYLQYVIIFFMFVAGTNFTLSYAVITGKATKIFKDEEFRFYTIVVLLFSLLIAVGLFAAGNISGEQAFRDSLFTVVSIITTTGYATADYLLWTPFLGMLIFVLFFVGGSAGSTGGGVKVVRILLLFKNSFYELKRLVHPNAVIPIRYNKHVVDQKTVTNILAFFVFYVIIFMISSILMSLWTPDIYSAFSAVATTLGNIGPGFGEVGPMENFYKLPDLAKWFLAFLMMLGRLELFTVLVLFSPSFWRH